ncbi:hypothetical protein SRHO_G00304230 [Serrasalmus rhombeus]
MHGPILSKQARSCGGMLSCERSKGVKANPGQAGQSQHLLQQQLLSTSLSSPPHPLCSGIAQHPPACCHPPPRPYRTCTQHSERQPPSTQRTSTPLNQR